jgi:hypothetical protein
MLDIWRILLGRTPHPIINHIITIIKPAAHKGSWHHLLAALPINAAGSGLVVFEVEATPPIVEGVTPTTLKIYDPMPADSVALTVSTLKGPEIVWTSIVTSPPLGPTPAVYT